MTSVVVQKIEHKDEDVVSTHGLQTVSTAEHFVIATGDYAAEGEADGIVIVSAFVDEEGNDITEEIAYKIAEVLS